MHRINKVWAAFALSSSSAALAAGDPAETAKAFGAREFIRQISLSPDGSKVAIVAPLSARGTTLLIADPTVATAPKAILQTNGDPARLTSCRWSSDTRLICNIFMISDAAGQRLTFTRLIAINSDGTGQKQVSAGTNDRSLGIAQSGGSVIDWLGDGKGVVLVTRSYVPESSIGTRLASAANGLGVEQVNVTTLARSSVEPARRSAVEYITDGNGSVRIMGTQLSTSTGYAVDRINYSYRKAGSEGWLPLSDLSLGEGTGFNPYAVDRALNVVYGFDRKDGRQALFKVALDGTLKRELVLDHPNVDVDELIRIGRQNRVVGASFATERRQAEFFDPELKRLRGALEKALPDHPLITFVDASADEKKLLLHASSDVDPGRYYVYNKATRGMMEVLPDRPELADIKLGTMKAVQFPAADGTMIPGYLTLPPGSAGKNVPAIVMPHGGPGARDEWGFDWWAQFFAARGYAVLQPNFRGSAGYGAEWFRQNGFKSWRIAISDVNDAGRWLQAQGIAAPGKLAIVGWSYGGYAALQSAMLDPALFKAIVAVAPVTDLEMLRTEAQGFTNFKLVDAFIGHGEHIREGSPARNAGRIQAPVLMFHGDQDQNVGVTESRVMAERLRSAGKKAELVEYDGLDHQLDDSAARTDMLTRSDAFLRTSLGL